MRIRFCEPLTPDFELVHAYLKESLVSGHLSNFGSVYTSLCNRFKDEVFNLPPTRNILLTSSGHTALMAAYAALGVKRLVVPSFTFEATRSAASLQGITPIIKDVDPYSGCFTVDILQSIDVSTYDAVVVVCALSTIPDLIGIQDYCIQNGKKLIIDAAPAFGTKDIYHYGDAFCLSFHATKTLPAGEGGAVILKSEYYSRAKSYINFGFDDNKSILLVGMNAKLSEYSCAILSAVLDIVEPAVESRVSNLFFYKKYLDEFIPPTSINRTVYQSLPLFLDSADRVNKIRQELTSLGIENLQYYKPLSTDFPIAMSLYSRNINLPIHQGVSEEDIQTISSVIRKFL